MIRFLLAAAAAVALAAASPAVACPDCHDCPMHKDKVAAAEKTDKKEGDKKPTCPCVAQGKECQCGENCKCPDCPAKHAKKDAKKT
jgi:hypothetical protein